MKTKYIASCSGGKDSVATVILAHIHNEPLDLIVFSEVMFDENISGEYPEQIDFVKNVLFPKFNEWGYETKILHSNKTYLDCFHHVATKGKRKGRALGFPMVGRCKINSECKVKPIRDFYKNIKGEYKQYIGIAIDEKNRLNRMKNDERKISLLEKYGYTEQMAYDLCVEYDLLSPVYSFAKRGGCWFCPNARDKELIFLKKRHPDLWNKLLELEEVAYLNDYIGDIWNTLTAKSIHDWDEYFETKEKLKIKLNNYLKDFNFMG